MASSIAKLPSTPEPPVARSAAARIRGALSAAEAALSVRELVEATGLHENAVRRNLKVLLEQREAYVQPGPAAHATPGRPTLRYRAGGSREAPYREVLPLLLTLLDQANVGREEAYRIGRSHALGPRPDGDAREALLSLLFDLGFAPVEETASNSGDHVTTIRLSRCPFADIVQAPSAATRLCALHHGLLAGVAEAAGGRLEGFTIVNPKSDCCRAHLRRSPSEG